MLDANLALQESLNDGSPGHGALNILLFLAAEDLGDGVTTSSCCNAMKTPRTTALRWISTLAGAGLVGQSADSNDRRITLLQLTPRANAILRAWLDSISSEA